MESVLAAAATAEPALLPKSSSSPMLSSSKRRSVYLRAVLFILFSYGVFILVSERDLFSCNCNSKVLLETRTATATTKSTPTTTTNTTSRLLPRRLAVASFVEGHDQIYGVYSIRNQLEKFNMTTTTTQQKNKNSDTVTQIVVIPNDIEPKFKTVLVEWLGADNVRSVDKHYLLNKITHGRIWKATFNKLWIFNLTDFDKIIMMDPDVLIRANLMHWFDYPAPCGVQAQDSLAWNSGAMVIEPNSDTFHSMLKLLPNMTRWNANAQQDTWSIGYSDQDFLTAFFTDSSSSSSVSTSETTTTTTTIRHRRCVMPTEAAVLSTSFGRGIGFDYFERFRPHLFETVHFTMHKPWRGRTRTRHAFVCDMLREWNESMVGIQKYLDPIQNDFLGACPPAT